MVLLHQTKKNWTSNCLEFYNCFDEAAKNRFGRDVSCLLVQFYVNHSFVAEKLILP